MTPDSAHSVGATTQIDVRDVPSIPIPGWAIAWHDGDFVATRTAPLTSYQLHYGALEEIACRDAGELFLLCEAQRRLAESLTTCEQLHEADRRQRIEAVQSQRQERPGES